MNIILSFISMQLLVEHHSDFGEYVCKATNNLGKVENRITIQRHPKPEPPAAVSVEILFTPVQ